MWFVYNLLNKKYNFPDVCVWDCWSKQGITGLDCPIQIVIQFGPNWILDLDCQSSFVFSIQIQNIIIILSKISNFMLQQWSQATFK